MDLFDPELTGEWAVVVDDGGEQVLPVADQIHLVDRQNHLADTHQRNDVAVAAGPGRNALAHIDQ